MGPVTVCGPRPGKSVRSFLISSMVRPGTTWLCECIIVSRTTVSPDSIFNTGGWALSNQPHCVVSSVAGRGWTFPEGRRLAGAAYCAFAVNAANTATATNTVRITKLSLEWTDGVETILR